MYVPSKAKSPPVCSRLCVMNRQTWCHVITTTPWHTYPNKEQQGLCLPLNTLSTCSPLSLSTYVGAMHVHRVSSTGVRTYVHNCTHTTDNDVHYNTRWNTDMTLGAILSPLLSLMYASAIPVALSGAQTFPGDTVPSLLQHWQAVWTEAASPSSLVPRGSPFGWWQQSHSSALCPALWHDPVQQNGQTHAQQAATAAGCYLHPVKAIHSAIQLHLYTELRNWLIAEALC